MFWICGPPRRTSELSFFMIRKQTCLNTWSFFEASLFFQHLRGASWTWWAWFWNQEFEFFESKIYLPSPCLLIFIFQFWTPFPFITGCTELKNVTGIPLRYFLILRRNQRGSIWDPPGVPLGTPPLEIRSRTARRILPDVFLFFSSFLLF